MTFRESGVFSSGSAEGVQGCGGGVEGLRGIRGGGGRMSGRSTWP